MTVAQHMLLLKYTMCICTQESPKIDVLTVKSLSSNILFLEILPYLLEPNRFVSITGIYIFFIEVIKHIELIKVFMFAKSIYTFSPRIESPLSKKCAKQLRKQAASERICICVVLDTII